MKIDTSDIVKSLIVAAIIGCVGAIIFQGRQISTLEVRLDILASLENRLERLEAQSFASEQPPNQPAQDTISVEPNELITILKEKQRQYVKESYGTESYQSFTEADLQEFRNTNMPDKIVESLRGDGTFLAVVLAIKRMPVTEQQDLLSRAENTFKPTWGQLGRVDREGQTDAGQEAERLIASSIVRHVRNLLRLSTQEILDQYAH